MSQVVDGRNTGQAVTRVACMVCGWIIGLAMVSFAHGQQPDLRGAAKQLRNHVVTIRVETRGARVLGSRAEDSIIVCSGVIVSKRFVVAPVFGGSDSIIRVTLPHGLQARGTMRVIDEYSGLALVRLDRDVPAGMELADQLPDVGAWVLSAAGWGSDEPVVSLGIVAGRSRRIAGLDAPPLLQVDLRTAATSSGAGVVDDRGRLIGIVAWIDKDRAGGWSYAVPVEHVQRVMRAGAAARNAETLVVLKRRRPIVGMVLEAEADHVVVARVTPGGPAAKAGIRVGDRIVAVDGHHIRSVYQAIRPVLARQPGDRIEWTVVRSDRISTRTVTLGGGVELPPTRLADLSRYLRPRIAVGRPPALARSTASPSVTPEVAVKPDGTTLQPVASSLDQQRIALLEKSVRRYQQTLKLLKDQLEVQEKERRALQRRLDVLQQELSELRRHEAVGPDGTPSGNGKE